MRELRFIPAESSASSLVFTTDNSEEFFVAVTPELREALDKVEEPAPTPAPEPSYSAPLSLRPREIQERIRSGASVSELAEEMGVKPERIESFAHPVLTERHRMAELARSGYLEAPSTPGAPTVGELVAQAFSQHDYDLERATWDAYRDSAGTWIATVTWTAGFTEYVAEWFVSLKQTGPTIVEPKNSTATDLISPRSSLPYEGLDTEETDEPAEIPEPEDETITGELSGDESLLQNPPEQSRRQAGGHRKRKRRTSSTPHWEDVLLGVRATRPPNGGKN